MPNVQTVFNTGSMLGKFKVTPFIHATGSQLGYSNTVPLFKNWWLLIIRDGYLPARLYSSALPATTPLQRTGTASIKSTLDQKHKNVSLTLLQ